MHVLTSVDKALPYFVLVVMMLSMSISCFLYMNEKTVLFQCLRWLYAATQVSQGPSASNKRVPSHPGCVATPYEYYTQLFTVESH